MESLFPPLFVILIVCLLLECLSLILMRDLAMATACRIIIFLLLGVAYMIKRALNRRRRLYTYNKYRYTRERRDCDEKQVVFYPFEIGLYQYIILIVCVATMIFHGVLTLSLVETRQFSLFVWMTSAIVTLDEYQELEWLHEYQQQQRRHHQRVCRNPEDKEDEYDIYEEDDDDDDDEDDEEEEQPTMLWISLYWRIYMFLFDRWIAWQRARTSIPTGIV